ncbi:hypothetical protein COW57_03775 [Candidatus Roizmanbacteria bacterium CG17_big_fil_post_rev_8_21_14_2_50_39_7]|uniref:SHOCT domain-containing protein n=2 Tax=Candidatus Roizmaniibacteriota TaxID=1752723 RepID=A0A2M7EJG8_9BACT|nr:MAG: hypothetical protein COS52_03750 [Candidatus Roizmanbacteria bacterium CG03_land_8_20_14_0_80_39_12]PIV70711.1 MAG: hypothetical protein COW57_03775 [Candidatus Roizmanbacteria bacterium CG17_big_fil_post_rev_8_21_14_2_50_39_7]
MYSPMSFWSGGFISLLANILVWGIIIYLVIHIVRKMSGSHHGGCCGMHDHDRTESERDDSYYLNIAKERYAKGEIDKKQFEELKKDLIEK